MLKQIQFKITKGMSQDEDLLSSSPLTAFRLYNIKSLCIDGNTLNSLTNELGTQEVTLEEITLKEEDKELTENMLPGIIIGCILCDNQAVIFTTTNNSETIEEVENNIIKMKDNKPFGKLEIKSKEEGDKSSMRKRKRKQSSNMFVIDRIYLLTLKDLSTIEVKLLAKGNFNFSTLHPITGIFCYENSELQKVYWVDGVNQLRFLNIKSENLISDENILNSSPKYKVDHHFYAEKIVGNGNFYSGVVLYCFTYFNKYGAETGIVDMTPIYYVAESTRGVAPNEKVNCTFKVHLDNPDTNFLYARVYSIFRSALEGLPVVKVVGDIKI